MVWLRILPTLLPKHMPIAHPKGLSVSRCGALSDYRVYCQVGGHAKSQLDAGRYPTNNQQKERRAPFLSQASGNTWWNSEDGQEYPAD